MKLVEDTDHKILDTKKVSDKEAEEAFKTILTWMGEDPSREGLLETFLVSKILLSVSSTNFIRQVYTVNYCF